MDAACYLQRIQVGKCLANFARRPESEVARPRERLVRAPEEARNSARAPGVKRRQLLFSLTHAHPGKLGEISRKFILFSHDAKDVSRGPRHPGVVSTRLSGTPSVDCELQCRRNGRDRLPVRGDS